MRSALQLVGAPHQHVRPLLLCPVLQAAGRPLLILAKPQGHVLGDRGSAGPITSGMNGDLTSAEVNNNLMLLRLQLDDFAHVGMRHRIVVLLLLHVIVDFDLRGLDDDITVRMCGKGTQCRLVEGLKSGLAMAGQVLEGPLIQHHKPPRIAPLSSLNKKKI
jgi:hypothetical protein